MMLNNVKIYGDIPLPHPPPLSHLLAPFEEEMMLNNEMNYLLPLPRLGPAPFEEEEELYLSDRAWE